MILEGIILDEGKVLGNDGIKYSLPVRGIDEDGYLEVLIGALKFGGSGSFHRQSIKPYIGYRVKFTVNPAGHGDDYEIIKEVENGKNDCHDGRDYSWKENY